MASRIAVARGALQFASSSRHTHHRLSFHIWRNYASRNILKLEERGLWADYFPQSNINKLIQELTRKPQTVYSGFDPTADSLHIGNLLIIVALLHCQRAGHNVIALIGGATAQIGDPSGRKTERPQLSVSEIKANSQKILENLNRIFSNHKEYFWDEQKKSSLPPIRTENNIFWYKNLNILDFLRDTGRHIRIGDMLSRTSVATRMSSAEGLSFTEFSYQVLQAHDWLYLYDKYNCTVQIGGSDQMGNVHTGYQLINKLHGVTVTGLTTPIISNEKGDKFGKSGGNPVWLDRSKTSPFDFYQFFVRVKDSEVEKYLKLLTFLPLEQIEAIMEKHKKKPEDRHAQMKLAEKMTILVHGKTGLESARRTTGVLYGNQPEVLVEMTKDELGAVFSSAPSAKLLLEPGTSILDMALKAGCFLNERDGRRIIEAGGFYINLSRVTKPDLIIIPEAHILPSGFSVIRVGKKNYYMIQWVK